MKKLSIGLLVASMIICLAACGPQKTEQPAEPSSAMVNIPVTASVDLSILKEQDDSMINTYSLIAVNPAAPWVDADGNSVELKAPLNESGADALINWILSEEGTSTIASYGFEEYGDYLFYLNEERPVSTSSVPKATEETKTIRLSTTTSVNDSGLLNFILPIFEEKYGYKVEVQSAGTGKAIASAKAGNADLILVHAKAQEEAFIDAGFARIVDGFTTERLSFMYNYFVLCGPSDDPAGVTKTSDVKEAFKAISDGKFTFISRGDGSGTHTKELSLWPEELGITEEPESFIQYTEWYNSANNGMGVCLTMAEQQHGYILSDKATFLTFQKNGGIMD